MSAESSSQPAVAPEPAGAAEPAPAASAPADTEQSARRAGRGFLLITGAKLWFMVSAAILNLGLPILFASPADYGAFGVVSNVVSLLNMVMIAGTLQAVSKVVSERPEQSTALVRRALLLQLALSLPIALGYFAAAHLIADSLQDPSYVPLLRVSAVIVAAYAFYAVFVGCFNGLQAFRQQASLDILFATLRVALILGAVVLGMGVLGAIQGFALASVVILGVSAVWLARWLRRRGAAPLVRTEAGASSTRLLPFMLSTMAYAFVLNAVMRIDLFALKRVSAGGLDALASSDASNALAGGYNLVLNVARLPYQAVIAVAFVIFPLLSRATFTDDRERTQGYIANTMRYSLLMTGGFIALFIGAGGDLLRVLYPAYAFAVPVLPLVCLGYGAFALAYIASTLLVAAGRSWTATALVGATGLLMSGLCWLWLDASQSSEAMLWGAAWAVAVSMLVGLALTAGALYRFFGAVAPLRSTLRILAITGVLAALGLATSFEPYFDASAVAEAAEQGVAIAERGMLGSRPLWLALAAGKAMLMGVLYLAGLLLSRELGAADWTQVRRVLGRRKSA